MYTRIHNHTSSPTHKALTVLLVLAALSLAALPALAAEETVNINEADASQLSLLPRVGPALAGRILEHREANGKFQTVDDLMLVRGIGEKTMQLLRPFVATSGKTTLASKVSVSRAEEAASRGKDAKSGDTKDGDAKGKQDKSDG